jgi:hypothetical protein
MLRILQGRLTTYIKREIAEEQAGFRRNRGTRDHIANVRWIIGKTREYGKPIFTCFVNYSKAFDCIDHNRLWDNLRDIGVPEHLIILIKNLYTNQEATVKTEDGSTDWFQVGKGVRQGCILSPYLFNMYSECIMRRVGLEGREGIKIGGRTIINLRYADDTTLITEDKQIRHEATPYKTDGRE